MTAAFTPALTVAQRRRATLQRAGKDSSLRNATATPTLAFYGILILTFLLVMFGLVMVLSASSVTMLHSGRSPWGIFNRQLFWATLGTVAMAIMYNTPYVVWRKYARYIFVGGLGLMALPFVPGLGESVNGTRAWVGTGVLRIQPSEILKIAVLLFCAKVLTDRRNEMRAARRTFAPMMWAVAFSSGACVVQGDLGSAIVLAAIVFGVMFIAGTRLTWLGGAAFVLGLAGSLMVLSTPYRRQRWTAFTNLEATKGHFGYQVYQSMISIANGGFSGVGVGEGAGKWGYVPLAHSDFIFAIIAEEFGFVGVVGVIGMYCGLVGFGIQAALGARDVFGALVAGGITAWFAVQAIINIGGVTGTIPVTGLTLPLISYGGSSLLVSMAAAGLLLNVARHMK